MKEELLYFVWKFGLTNPNLQTVSGKNIQIINSGIQNHLSGPDFSNAKIKIEDKTWFGNVEIHVKTSDWLKHGHSSDKAYDSIILHVVYENDIELEEHLFRKIPTLELKNYVSRDFLNKYQKLQYPKGWIPCETQLANVDDFHKSSWLERLKIVRLERKTEKIAEILKTYNGDWEYAFLVWICRAYGFKFNAEPMEWLGANLSSKILINSKNVESLLLGISGLLPNNSNEFYIHQLKKEFDFEKSKWSLEPLDSSLWKTGGVRPPNQPAIRIAQLAAFLRKCNGSFWSSIVELKSLIDIQKYIQTTPNEYWKTHYGFGVETKMHTAYVSKASFNLIMINAIIPFLFLYGKEQNKPELTLRAQLFLDSIKPESNSIIFKWKKIGQSVTCAGDTQALLELYNEYCSKKKCLICGIGNKLLIK